MKKKKILFLAVSVLILTLLAGFGNSEIFAKSRKKAIREENKKLESLHAQMQEEITGLDKKLTASNEKYEEYASRKRKLGEKICKTQEELKKAGRSKEKQYEIMQKRIKFLYENGNTAYLEIIFEAKSLQEFLNKAEYVSKISKYDSTMFQKLKQTEEKIQAASKQLKRDYKDTAKVTAEAKKEKDKLDQIVMAKKGKLADYQKKLTSNRTLLAQFEAEEQRQQEQEAAGTTSSDSSVGNGESTSGGNGSSSGGGSFSGSLAWPVPSCHAISSGYGYRIHPVTGKRKLHAGIDIPCSTGSTIVASEGGSVVDAGYNAYNGNYLKIRHGNGLETMYLHCSRLLVSSGSRVRRGQTIAKSGATGMVSGAHLHFVVKKNGSYVNPSNYL
jgi:murein DD-endopeptidase MepM/ murein hydrolase activator NlpD